MSTFKFKTNINCSNCIRSVTPFLNELDKVDHWQVDTENPEKILTVEGDAGADQDVLAAVKESGFEAARID